MPYEEFRVKESLAKDRPFITAGGAALATIAGYINIIMLSNFHTPVSHMSGAASRLGIALVSRHLGDLRIVISILVSFYVGAALSGFVISTPQLRPGRRYGVVLVVEGILLAVAEYFLNRGSHFGIPIAALTCGLQNAMASSYYGLVIRTTHVTGIVTDLGVMTGRRLKGHKVEGWKVVLLCSLLAGFIGGGIIAALVLAIKHTPTLWPAAVACLGAGTIYAVWMHVKHGSPVRSRPV